MKISKDKTDKLFSEKLEGYSKAPREQAWLKLESKLQQKQKKVVPIWQRLGFAASVTLLIFAGILAYFYQPTYTPKVDQVADSHKNKILKPELNVKNVDSDVATLVISNAEEKKITNTLNTRSRKRPIFQTFTESGTLNIGNTKQQLSNFKINQQNELANQNVAQVLNSQPIENKGIENKIIPSEDLTVVVTLANFEEFKNTSNENQEVGKKTKFLFRLFKQMINAKNGDKVEWNKIGLKPAKIFARAESRLKSTSEGFNNSYQSTKDKTIL